MEGLPRHWVAGSQHTSDVVTNPKRHQVGDLSSLTAPGFWPRGDARRLEQRKLHLHVPDRLPEKSRPVLFWGLELVQDIAHAARHVPEAGAKLPRKLLRKAVGVPGAVDVLLHTGLVHSLPTSRREEELWGVADITHKEGTFKALRSLV